MGMRHIRTSVFKLKQSEFAEIADTTQATVSRWEAGELEPDRVQLAKIRVEAEKRQLPWNDEWFFVSDGQENVEVAA